MEPAKNRSDPSVYYGSEVGMEGRKGQQTDAPLRPALSPVDLATRGAHLDLLPVITRLSALRRKHVALRRGSYEQLHVSSEQIAFARDAGNDRVVIAINGGATPAEVRINAGQAKRFIDVLNPGATFECRGGTALVPIDARWGRALVPES